MNRREMLTSLAAAAALPTLHAEATPAPRCNPDLLAEHVALSKAWSFADEYLERALVASLDMRDALSEYRHQHDLRAADHDCGCYVCIDIRGWLYVLEGPLSILESALRIGDRLKARQRALEQADQRRDAEMDRLLEHQLTAT